MENYYSCCGKSVCRGCLYSFCESGNEGKCPFCNSDGDNKTAEEMVEEIRKRAEANDPGAMCALGNSYCYGENGFPQDQTKAMDVYTRAAGLSDNVAHYVLAGVYHRGGDLKKAKFHFEVALWQDMKWQGACWA